LIQKEKLIAENKSEIGFLRMSICGASVEIARAISVKIPYPCHMPAQSNAAHIP